MNAMDQQTTADTADRRKEIFTELYKLHVPESVSRIDAKKKSYGCGFYLILALVRSIAMLVVGCIYIHDCTSKEMIPIFLIVSGSMGVFGQVLMGYTRYRQHKGQETSCFLKFFNGILPFVQMIWFIVGLVVIYGLPEDNRYPPYCNHFLYTFAFWMVTIGVIIVLAISFVCCFIGACVGFCIMKIMMWGSDEDAQPDQPV